MERHEKTLDRLSDQTRMKEKSSSSSSSSSVEYGQTSTS